ncbi:MAG: alginate export family protein [Nitrospirae bacterium]|nr:alginate export family protein [Nitrospirota bacterium]
MKKIIALIVGTVFVVGFAVSAFAIHATIPAETTAVVAPKDIQIKLGGEMRFRGWYESNITDSAGAKATTGRPYDGSSMSWYDQRFRLGVDVKAGDNVSGKMTLETGVDSSSTTTDVNTWGSANSYSTVRGGQRPSGLDTLLEGWLAYTGSGLLGVPSGIKIGHMPLMVGAGQFFDHRQHGDDAILFTVEPAKGTEINLITAKLSEDTTTDNTNDIDLYTIAVVHKLDKDNSVGIDYSTVNQSNSATITNYTRLNLQNLGLNANGNMSGIGYRASADIQFGETKTSGATPEKVKFKGYGITLGANYNLDPVTLRASFAMGSGNKTDTADKNEAFQTLVGTIINYTVAYDYRVHTACSGSTTGTGICNTTYYNIGLTASPVKDMTVALDYFLLRATKKLTETANSLGNKKDIGSEIDLKATYKLAKNLTYFINSGILFADNFYKAAASGATSDPKDAVVFQHGITLSF